jgi:hypothetical protein
VTRWAQIHSAGNDATTNATEQRQWQSLALRGALFRVELQLLLWRTDPTKAKAKWDVDQMELKEMSVLVGGALCIAFARAPTQSAMHHALIDLRHLLKSCSGNTGNRLGDLRTRDMDNDVEARLEKILQPEVPK